MNEQHLLSVLRKVQDFQAHGICPNGDDLSQATGLPIEKLAQIFHDGWLCHEDPVEGQRLMLTAKADAYLVLHPRRFRWPSVGNMLWDLLKIAFGVALGWCLKYYVG